jgi:hypothetical protein
MDGLHEEIGGGEEIGIEDEDELSLAGIEASLQRAGLEAGAVHAVDVLDVEALRPEALDLGFGDLASLVRGIVENLDLEQVPGVVELADALEKALDDVKLIEDRELDGDVGKGVEETDRARHVLAMLEEEINDDIPVNSVEGEAKEHGEVTDCPNEVSGAFVHSCVLRASSEAG